MFISRKSCIRFHSFFSGPPGNLLLDLFGEAVQDEGVCAVRRVNKKIFSECRQLTKIKSRPLEETACDAFWAQFFDI